MSSAEASLLERVTAFTMCPLGAFSFAIDSHNVRGISTTPPRGEACLDLADVLTLTRPIGERRTLALFDPGHADFHLTVGPSVQVRNVAWRQVERVPTFIASLDAMRYAMAIIDHEQIYSYLLDTVALAKRHRQGV